MFNFFSGSQGSPSDSGSRRRRRRSSRRSSRGTPSTVSTTTVELPPEGSRLPSPEDPSGPSLHSSFERNNPRGTSLPRTLHPNGSRHTRSHSLSPPTYPDGPSQLRLDTGDEVDEKGKMKRRHQAVNPYMSPPLTNAPASESFLSGIERVSRVLSRGLDLDIVEDDLEDELEAGSQQSVSSGSTSSLLSDMELRQRIREKEQQKSEKSKGKERMVEPSSTVFNIIEVDEEEPSFDISSSSLTSRGESTTTRQATVGDTTLDDPGSIVPSVRFPAIFNQGDDEEELDEEYEISTLESTPRTEGAPPLPIRTPQILPIGSPVDEELPQTPLILEVEEEESLSSVDDIAPAVEEGRRVDYGRGRTHYRPHPAYMGVKHGKPRMLRRKRWDKSQERGLSRDFFLIIALCLGLACAGILILRPTAMALLGYSTLLGRLELDIY